MDIHSCQLTLLGQLMNNKKLEAVEKRGGGDNMKVNRVRKMLLSLTLAAALAVEPAAGSVAYASEVEVMQETTVDGEEEEPQQEDQVEQEEKEEENPVSEEETGEENSDPEEAEEDSEKEETGEQESSEEQDTSEEEQVESGDDSISDNDLEETEPSDAELSEDSEFAGMPEGYKLNSAQQEEKAELSGYLGDIEESDEGTAYVARQVMTLAGSEEEAAQIAKAYNASIVSYENELLVLELGEGTSVCDAVKAAASEKTNLPAVWPNYYRYAHTFDEIEIEEEEYDEGADIPDINEYVQAAANDPNLNPMQGQNYQWQHATVGSSYAWAEGYTGAGVSVAVIDSGIVSAHEDLSVASHVDKTGLGSAEDVKGHGTHVAGIIAAKKNNGKGGAGIAPDATVHNIRVLDDNGSGTDDKIYQGIKAAIAKNVDLINMSLGGPGYNQVMQDVMNEAYSKGIAVFVSAGNDGIETIQYPACYKHVICVGATDNGNGRADFSTYGSWVDISAPGVDIYSTYKGGASSYAILSGTSMSCPVATGEAAVILSSGIVTSTGSDRVDELERIMKKNTVKVNGAKMGSGIVSLPKVFHLATAAAKPYAPEIKITLSDDKQSVNVAITAQAGMKIAYTTNGKSPVYKDGAVDSNTSLTSANTISFALDCSKTAKGSVKAIAINGSGVASTVKSQTYTLAPYVNKITISGPTKVAKGKAITLKAEVMPAYAANKSVTWSVKTSGGQAVDAAKIKVANGKVSVTAKADLGTYVVTATAKDKKAYSASYKVQVVEAGTEIQSLAFDKNAPKEMWITKSEGNPTLDLKTVLIAKEKDATGSLVEIAKDNFGGNIIWSSSNSKVATVNANTGVVTAKMAGTVSVTAQATDSGNKKATIKIAVKQGVTGIIITTDKGKTDSALFKVAVGKDLALKAKITPAKPANQKVIWSIDSTDPKVTINASNGKVSAKAGAVAATYTVKATAADGKGAVATRTIKVCAGNISKFELDKKKATLYTTKIDQTKTNQMVVTAVMSGTEGFDQDAYIVTSSNPDVATVSAKRTGTSVAMTITATGKMYGKTNITIEATDGSKQKAVCAVTVSGNIKAIAIKDASKSKDVKAMTLFRSGTQNTTAATTATLYAVLTSTEGANTNAYKVESSNTNLLKIQSFDAATGKIVLKTGSQSAGKVAVTVTATDGSKKKAVCNVTVANPVSKVNIASKTVTASGQNYQMAVVSGKSLQLCATLETENGAISNKGVTWSINAPKSSGISISQSGKVSAAKNKSVGSVYTVTAVAKDGSGASATYTVGVVSPASLVYLYSKAFSNFVYPWQQIIVEVAPDVDGQQQLYGFGIYSNIKGGYISVKSSNSKVLEVASTQGMLFFTPRKPGTATVTLQATDGSGVKTVYHFKVVK